MDLRKANLIFAAVAAAALAAPAGAFDGTRSSVINSPASVSESNPAIVSQPEVLPAHPRDNRNLPNPVTPSAANESAPQPQAAVNEPTNSPGISPPPVGGTR